MNLFLLPQGLLFVISVIVTFYLPGSFLLRKLKIHLHTLEKIFFATTLGIIFFTLITYMLSWLNLWILIVPLLLFFLIIELKNLFFKKIVIEKKHRYPLIIILIFSLVFSLTSILSGEWEKTIRLFGSHIGDSIWHLAIINELVANFPPNTPGFPEVPLRGYHFFYDFLLAQVSKIYFISPVFLYFQFFPLLISFLWALGVYICVFNWSKSVSASLWAIFFTMFGGSFGFILWLQGHKQYSLDDVFGITQPSTALVNPPFAISIVIIIATLFGIFNYLEKKQARWLIPIVLFVGMASVFKVYSGIILGSGFFVLMLCQFTKKKREVFLSIAGVGFLFLITYWVFREPTARLIWYPFWSPHKVVIEHLPWYGFEEKHYTFSELSVLRGLVEIEMFAFFVFIVGSLGTRVIGLLAFLLTSIRRLRIPSLFTFTLLMMTFTSIGVPLFFIQSVQVFDIIQMAWYFLFFSSLFAALGFENLFKSKLSKNLKLILIVLIIAFTLPSAYEKYIMYLSDKNALKYTDSEYESLVFLKKLGSYNDVVLELPENINRYSDRTLYSWYRNERTGRIPAFSNKQVFFHKRLDLPWLVMEPKYRAIQAFSEFEGTAPKTESYKNLKKSVEKILKDNHIKYIYSQYPLRTIPTLANIRKIFQNKSAYIYEVY